MIHQLTIHVGDFAGIINILTVSITRFFLLEMIMSGGGRSSQPQAK